MAPFPSNTPPDIGPNKFVGPGANAHNARLQPTSHVRPSDSQQSHSGPSPVCPPPPPPHPPRRSGPCPPPGHHGQSANGARQKQQPTGVTTPTVRLADPAMGEASDGHARAAQLRLPCTSLGHTASQLRRSPHQPASRGSRHLPPVPPVESPLHDQLRPGGDHSCSAGPWEPSGNAAVKGDLEGTTCQVHCMRAHSGARTGFMPVVW